MRKILFLVTVTFLLCSMDKSDKDDPNNIPGMGDVGGELEAVLTLSI